MAKTVSSTILNFGMVSVPVSLKKAADKNEVGFQLASADGNAVQQVYVDKVTGEVVGPSSECKRGIFEDPKNGIGFHEVPAETIKAIDESCKLHDLTIDGFISLDEVPFERAEGAYFIAPQGKTGPAAAKPLALLHAALTETGRAGIGKLTLRSKQRAFVVYAENGGLVLNTLAFADAFTPLKEASEAISGVEVTDKSLGLAKTLIEAQTVKRAVLDAYIDKATPLKAELVAAALAGETIAAPEAPEVPETTQDLEAALIASIGAEAPAPKSKKKKEAVPA